MNTGTDFRFVQFNTKHGRGIACVSLKWRKNDDGNLDYEAGLSFCSPKDRFNGVVARTIADNRRKFPELHKDDSRKARGFFLGVARVQSDSHFVTNADFESIAQNIFAQADEAEFLPTWAKKAWKRREFVLGLRDKIVSANQMNK